MNRTDRLYALVEELRAVAPRPRSARWLAGRFEVSARTIERDIGALQQSGVPIYVELGRNGGYLLDRASTLPPLNMTPGEAVAIAVALHGMAGTPFHATARQALQKVLAVMPARDRARAEELAGRIHLVEGADPGLVPESPVTAEALGAGRVLELTYADRNGVTSRRLVEPLGLLGGNSHWYLLAWCRLRDELRSFRLDRIRAAATTAEPAEPRALPPVVVEVPNRRVIRVAIGG